MALIVFRPNQLTKPFLNQNHSQMKKLLLTIFCCSYAFITFGQASWNSGSDYQWWYNFGSGTGTGGAEFTGISQVSISTPGSLGFLPKPISGSARVSTGSSGTPIFTLDEGSEDLIKFQASSSDNIGKISFYNIAGATPLSAIFLTLNFDNNEAVGGNFRLAMGFNNSNNNPGDPSNFFNNGSSVQNTGTGTNYTDIFGALRWTFSTDPTKVAFEYRELTGSSVTWKTIPVNFYRGTEYALEILCNNTGVTKSYLRGSTYYDVLPRSYQMWSNGVRLQTADNGFNFPANELASDIAINSVLIQGSQSKGLTTVSSNPLVYVSPTGNLAYEPYANLSETNKDNVVPDFSNAGYQGGGVSLPDLPVKKVLTPVSGNNLNQIQAAIDEVGNLPLNANGFRGVVLLEAGLYNVDGTLFIKKSGVVLRGAGQGSNPANNTVIYASKAAEHTLIRIEGTGSGFGEVNGTRKRITTPYVGTGAKSFEVESASGYAIGDAIAVYRVPNDFWIDDLGMRQYGWIAGEYDVAFERRIVNIQGNTITIDAPVIDPIQTKYGGGYIYKANISGRISNSGVENMRLTSYYANDTDENHGWEAVKLSRATNCWVKKVTAQYFGYSCVSISSQSSYNTIEECAMVDPKSQTTGGRKYSFNMTGGSFNLFQRCYTWGGRHDFVTGARTAGPNVFLDCYAENTQNDMGPHQRWATGILFDNIRAGIMHVENRKASGTGHGWTGAQVMFWNSLSYKGEIGVHSPKGAMNWAIGSIGLSKTGTGYFESWGANVSPRSLYLTQLKDRLGNTAVENVTSPAQRTGNIYNALKNWAGEGSLSIHY